MYKKYISITLLVATLVSFVSIPLSAKPDNEIRVLIIDSGSDFTHDALEPNADPCPLELNGKKGVDDNGSGYIDDLYGWNFVESNNILVNLDDTPPEYEKVLRCMQLLGKLQAYGAEGMDPAEYSFLVQQYQNQSFWAWVDFTGGWAHGTHCAGIVSSDGNAVPLKAIKHLPTGNTPRFIIGEAAKKLAHLMAHLKTSRSMQVPISELEKFFDQLSQQYIDDVTPLAKYIGFLKPRLINCSFGTDNAMLVEMMKKNMKNWGYVNPSAAEIQKIVNLFVKKVFLPRDKAMFSYAPDALVFIAAGNSGENLDPFACSPNDVPIDNKIVIGATDEDQKIAPFSDYGVDSVDVAVPGVNIYATYPNQQMGYMSGTSMACPMAVQFASRILQERPALNPLELKKIIMETVDKKDWLADKVRSGGVINVHRGIYAARLMNEGKNIDTAIKLAREKVADKAHKSAKKTRPNLKNPLERKLYFSIIR